MAPLASAECIALPGNAATIDVGLGLNKLIAVRL